MADPTDTGKHGKVSDSAYSNSSSNSQSRRSDSQSSKSNIRSGSNSSGSSGYGDNPSSKSSGASDNHAKRATEKPRIEEESEEPQKPAETESIDIEETPTSNSNVAHVPQSGFQLSQETTELQDRARSKFHVEHGFSCVVSYDEGIIMYSTPLMHAVLGYPKEMWIGRNFIDFIHARDQGIFAAQMSTRFVLAPPPLHPGLPSPMNEVDQRPSVHCRLRRHTGLATAGFGIRDRRTAFITCKMHISLKDISDNGNQKIYMVIQIIPVLPAYQEPLQKMRVPRRAFVTRHTAAGVFEYVDPESVPLLGYLPHLLAGKCAIQLYHPDDLVYLRDIYDSMVKCGQAPKATYRMLINNGDYVRLETEWTCFVNPWSRKLEFVTGLHVVSEGPSNCNIFEHAECDRSLLKSSEDRVNAELTRAMILRILSDFRTKPAVLAKQQMVQKCQNISSFMEKLMEDSSRPELESRPEAADQDMTVSERDSVLLGGVSPHRDYCDSKSSSTDTTPSYNQLNYRDNLQRYFGSRPTNNMYDAIDVCLTEERQESSVTCCSTTELSESASACCGEAVLEEAPPTPVSNQPRLTESALIKHNVDMERGLAKHHRKTRRAGAAGRMQLRQLARCRGPYRTSAQSPAPLKQGLKRAGSNLCTQGKQRKETQVATDETSSTAYIALAAHETMSVESPEDRNMDESAPGPASAPLYTPNNIASNWPVSLAMDTTIPITVASATAVAASLPMHLAQDLVRRGPRFPFSSYIPVRAAATANVTTAVAIVPSVRANISIGLTTMSAPIRPFSHLTSSVNAAPITLPMALGLQPMQTRPLFTLGTSSSSESNYSGRAIEDMIRSEAYMNMSTATLDHGQLHWSAAIPSTAIEYNIPISANTQGYWQPQIFTPATAIISDNAYMHSADDCQPNTGLVESKTLSNKNSGGACPNSSAMTYDPNSSSDIAEERTDAETSSSFYSSFLQTDSASAEDDVVKSGSDRDSVSRNRSKCIKWMRGQSTNVYGEGSTSDTISHNHQDVYANEGKMKPEPPWMDQVSFSFDLHYKYQVPVKNKQDIMEADKKFLAQSQQSQEVNDQLGQLYLDLQMQGLTSRLTLEEGLTSSGSSGEDSITKKGVQKKRRPYSKVEMLFEENAPLPPPDGLFLLPRPVSRPAPGRILVPAPPALATSTGKDERIPAGDCRHAVNEGSPPKNVDSAVFIKPLISGVAVASLHN